MANTYVDYTGADGTGTDGKDFNFSFEYLRDEHVKVKVNDVIVTNYTIVTSPTPTKIRFNTAPAASAEIRIYRDSRGDFSPLVDFVDGSVLTENELDESYKHNLFVAQEASEGTGNELLNKKGGANYDAEGNKIINLGTPGDSTDAANKGYVDQTIDNSIALGGSPAIVSLGGYDVTALGSTRARSLATRFADITNVLDYGTDTDAIQAAVDAAGVGGTVLFPAGTYTVTTNVNNRQIFLGEKNAEINCGTAGITMFERNGEDDGSNGSLCFRNLRFLGEGTRSSKAIFVSPNTPHVLIDNCYFRDFSEAVHLIGSYMSRIESCSFSNNYKGLHLVGDCHASGVHSSIFHNKAIRGGATKSYGIAINGDEIGQDSGAKSLHNIVIANTALQNSDYGCWAEKCENISFENIYHEGNYTADIQLGVDDGSTNVRNVFGAVLDSVETSSPVQNRATNKGCINLEHVFRPRIRNVLFASGIPTSGTLLYLDGYTRYAEIQISEITGTYGRSAGNFEVGKTYTIITAGTTDFTLIGAANSDPGTTFVATGAGTGTGVARGAETQQDAIYMNGDSKFRTKVIEDEIEMFTNSKGGEFHGVGWRSEASSNTKGDFNIYHDQPIGGRNALNIKAAEGSGNFDIRHYSGSTGQIHNYIGTSLLTVAEASAFRPGDDGVTNLGAINKRWNVAYAKEINFGDGGRIITGEGSPEGVIVTSLGAIYINVDGGTGTTLYVKETGDGLSTGWVAK